MSGGMREVEREGEELEKQSERAGANPYGGGCPMNLGTHRSRTAERNATGADTEGCAPFDTTATSHGGDKEPCPGLQISEWDSN